jgi:hypothetical protein
MKRSRLTLNTAMPFTMSNGGSGNEAGMYLYSDDTIWVQAYVGGFRGIKTSGVFRDPSAWAHVLVVYDTGNGTQADRCRFYYNGVRVSLSTACTLGLNDAMFGNGWNFNIGCENYGSYQNYMDGYFADFYYVDGQAKSATDFGEYDTNGVWRPKAYTGAYGNNGFHLDFSDANNLGKDVAGINKLHIKWLGNE